MLSLQFDVAQNICLILAHFSSFEYMHIHINRYFTYVFLVSISIFASLICIKTILSHTIFREVFQIIFCFLSGTWKKLTYIHKHENCFVNYEVFVYKARPRGMAYSQICNLGAHYLFHPHYSEITHITASDRREKHYVFTVKFSKILCQFRAWGRFSAPQTIGSVPENTVHLVPVVPGTGTVA